MTSFLDELADDVYVLGIRRAFGVPGGGASLSLIDSLAGLGVDFFNTHFEGTAALMAGMDGLLSGGVGLSIGIKGPGVANALPGLAACHLESLPMILVAEAYPPGRPNGTIHKLLDDEGLTAPIVKAGRYLAASGPSIQDLAEFGAAERPGPVLLRIAGEPVEQSQSLPAQKFQEEPKAARQVLAAIRSSQAPIVVVGAQASRLGHRIALSQLEIPTFTTPAAKGAISENSPACAGVFTGVGRDRTVESLMLSRADLIVLIGVDAFELLRFPAGPQKVVAIADWYEEASIQCHATARMTLATDVLSELARFSWGLEEIGPATQNLRRYLCAGDFLPGAVLDRLEETYGEEGRLVVDTGNFCTVAEHVWRAPFPHRYVGSSNGRYMGIGLPMALGAAFADPRPTILATGDGGIGMFFGELQLAARWGLPLLVVLMSDGGFGSIRGRAIRDGLNQSCLLVGDAPWCKAAEGLGIPAHKVSNANAFEAALHEWVPADGPMFIEAVFDPDAYRRMVEGVR